MAKLRMTTDRRQALALAAARGINPKTDDHVPAKVLADLEQAGLIHLTKTKKGRPTWKATDEGRGLLSRSGLLPVFMHRRSQHGYTSSLALAMWSEPEVLL